MTNGPGKSDRPVVPEKSPNKAGQPAAEGMEGRGLAKGNLRQQNAPRTPSRKDAPSALERVRQAAKQDSKLRFTALLHHIYNLETLRMAYGSLKKEAAPGVDGERWRHYGKELETNLQDLAERLKRGAYRAQPVRRVYIPKANGRQRPLGVTALEDKIVQRANSGISPSTNVGWVKTASCSAVKGSSAIIAICTADIISPAPTPKAVKPRIRSLSAAIKALRNPRVSESVRARRFASIGILNNRYGMPCACASVSFRPKRASSGSVNRQYRTCLPVVIRLPSVMLAGTTRKSSTLMCVNCGLPATSPIRPHAWRRRLGVAR